MQRIQGNEYAGDPGVRFSLQNNALGSYFTSAAKSVNYKTIALPHSRQVSFQVLRVSLLRETSRQPRPELIL